LKENMEKINAAVGKTWTFECDIAKIVSDPEAKGYADRPGEIIYGSYLEQMAQCIEDNCKDELTKEELLGAVNKNKLMFRFNPKTNGYQQWVIEDGVLIVQCKATNFWTNVYDVANANFDKLVDWDKSKLPLVSRKDMKKYEEKYQEHLANIRQTVGKDWVVDFDWKTICSYPTVDPGYKGREGEILMDSYMERIAQCISENCKDDMVKEALVEAVSANKIIFRLNEKTVGYHQWLIEKGCLVLQCKGNNLWCNLSDVGYQKLDKLL